MHLSDVRGWTRVATDATAEVTRVVEAVHEAVLGVPCLRGTPVHAPVVAITRLVYRSIYAITRTTGHGVDGVLGALEPLAPEAPSNAARDRVVAALNGVIGDHLARSANPLASRMSAKYNGASLDADPHSLRAADPPLGRKLMLLVHGLCMSPAAWARQGEDRAAALAEQLGFTPLHIQYNSGLHVSVNGRALAEWLDALLRAWPVPLEELVIVGHSMGGLVARSALHYGSAGGHAWRDVRLTVVFLGTPHHGAPLERHGHGVHRLLRLSGFTAPFERLGRMRSAGITDLRHGNLIDEDWDEHHRFVHAHDTRSPVPLPGDVRCFAVAGSLDHREGGKRARPAGDGLVPVGSALGHHRQAARRLSFPASHQWVAHGTGHRGLVSDPRVFRKIHQWLDPDAAESRRAADTSRSTRQLTGPRSTPAEEKL